MESVSIYDGVGIIDCNKFQMPMKDRVVTIGCRDLINNEERYYFLKGLIKPFDLSSFIKQNQFKK